MAVSAKVTGVNYHSNGHIYVNYDDGTGEEYTDFTHLQETAAQVDDPANVALVRSLLLGHWLAVNAEMNNSSLIIGKTLTLDMSEAAPVAIEEP